MTASFAGRFAFLFLLLAPLVVGRTVAGVRAGPGASESIAPDLLSVGDAARLPETGHVRFVRGAPGGALIFVGLSGGALERSADGGRSWREVTRGVPGGVGAMTLDLQISQSDPGVVWAAGLSGVYRSVDGGLTWMERDIRGDGPGRALGSVLALDPRHPEAAYLAGYRGGGLYLTSDGGASWQRTLDYPVSGVAVDPADGSNLYAISRTSGVQRSVDHGRTWSRGVQPGRYAGVGEETASAGRLVVLHGPAAGLYAALDGGGLIRSTDRGSTWQDISDGLPQSAPGAGYTVPYGLTAAGDRLYLILSGTGSGRALFAASIAALAALSVPVASTLSGASRQTSGTSAAAGALWQVVAANVDAVAAPPGNAPPLVALDGRPGSGLQATVGALGMAPLFGVPYLLPPPLVRVSGTGFAYGAAALPYVYGINYEGPNDRPWQMWQDGKFDASLIARDLDAAAATGYRVLRVFVQDPLPQQVLAGEFGHLDALAALARQRDLRLLITFNDSRDRDLARVARVDRLIAAHFAGNPTIFGYDLQNEPNVRDIAGAAYPAGIDVPLQDPALVAIYGESVSLRRVRADRTAGMWLNSPFDRMSDTQIYAYRNALNILDRYLGGAAAPDGTTWAPLLRAANGTLAAFIKLQMDAVRGVDAGHPITVGYNSMFWSFMGANGALDFRSIHLYPPSGDWNGIHGQLRELEDLRAALPTPLVLGEYGFSTAAQSSAVAGVQETAMDLYLRVLGGAGSFKWVLNDDLVGFNAYENGLGLFGKGGVPKAGYYANRAIASYFAGPHRPGGARMVENGSTGVSYLYAAPDAIGVSGEYADARMRYSVRGHLASAQLWMDWALPGRLRIASTHEADLWLNLERLVGAQPGPLSLAPADPLDRNGLRIHIHLQAGVWYALTYLVGSAVPPLSPELPSALLPQGWYILGTGHNVAPPFLKTWLALGGVSLAGAPLAEAQPLSDGAVQYYTNIALRATGASTTPLPLGLRALGGSALPAAAELPKRVHHFYSASTGHNLRGAFLRFFERTGGLGMWGPPLSEEIAHGSLTVQYLMNAEFVWDGSALTLAPLGGRAWAASTH